MDNKVSLLDTVPVHASQVWTEESADGCLVLVYAKTFNKDKNNEKKELLDGDDEDEDEDMRKAPIHKKSFIFNSILKLKSIKCPRLLEEQWIYEKILLDYNIIDFTCKKNYINFLIYSNGRNVHHFNKTRR